MACMEEPCVSFNKINTYQWFKEHTYDLEDSHDPLDRDMAFRRAIETEKLPLGVLYVNPDKPAFEENLNVYQDKTLPVWRREFDNEKFRKLIGLKSRLTSYHQVQLTIDE